MTTSANIAQSATSEQNRSDVTQASASLIGRVLLSAIFILSGFSKLAAPAMMVGYTNTAALKCYVWKTWRTRCPVKVKC